MNSSKAQDLYLWLWNLAGKMPPIETSRFKQKAYLQLAVSLNKEFVSILQ